MATYRGKPASPYWIGCAASSPESTPHLFGYSARSSRTNLDSPVHRRRGIRRIARRFAASHGDTNLRNDYFWLAL